MTTIPIAIPLHPAELQAVLDLAQPGAIWDGSRMKMHVVQMALSAAVTKAVELMVSRSRAARALNNVSEAKRP